MLYANLKISSSLEEGEEDQDYDKERYYLQGTLRNDINYYRNCNQLYLQREVIKANLCVSKGTR